MRDDRAPLDFLEDAGPASWTIEGIERRWSHPWSTPGPQEAREHMAWLLNKLKWAEEEIALLKKLGNLGYLTACCSCGGAIHDRDTHFTCGCGKERCARCYIVESPCVLGD